MWTQFGSLSVVPWILFAQTTWDMSEVPLITAAQPTSDVTAEVRDRGGMFSPGAERRAREALRRVHRRHRIPVLVETIRSLDGAWIADIAQRRARAAGPDRLYILIAGDERDVGVIGALHGPASRLTDGQRETIRRSFLGPLQASNPDEAIERGVQTIGATLDEAAASPRTGVRDAMITAAMLLAAAAALLASRNRPRSRDESEQRRRTAAESVPYD
jgi:uncharacterized membrane protein YgcG